MRPQNISYLAGTYSALGVRLDAAHVKDGRWTPAEYADTRRYRAEVYELGFDAADALVWSAERGRYVVYGWQTDSDPEGRKDIKVDHIPDGQTAQAVAELLAFDGYDTDTEHWGV